MGPFRRFWRLPTPDRSLLVKTAALLGATRIALPLLPLTVIRRLLSRAVRRALGSPSRPAQEARIVWAVCTARRIVPDATCLAQALVTEALCAQSGYPAAVRIGVAKTAATHLVAHAWVESEGRIVVGNLPDLARYTPLPPLPGGCR
jgi:transglutaminase superfamily protein